MSPKVLVIGLDAATFDLIEPWVDEGLLPNLAHLMHNGVYGELLSVPNMNSAPAWSTFATGKTPGEHGVFYFSRLKPGSYEIEPINASFRQGKTFWRYASDHNRKVTIINVPISYPAESVNGNLIAGIDTPYVGSEGFTYPSGLYEELRKHIGSYEIEVGMPSLIKAGKLNKAIDRARWTATQRYRAVEYLMASKPWDLFVTVFTGIDVMQHFFWKYMADDGSNALARNYQHAIRDFYIFMDDYVGRICKMAGEDVATIIMSDHGAGPLCEATMVLPKWLAKNDYLYYRTPESQDVASRQTMKVIKTLYRLIDTNLTRNQKLFLARLFPRIRSQVESAVLLGNIDWSKTKVYSAESRNELRINLQGREPQGIVSPGLEYEAVREEVISRLMAWRSPAGEEYVQQVFKREEVYSGRYFDMAPDILIHWNPTGGEIEVDQSDDLFNYHVNGDHQPNGILIANGPGFSQGKQVDDARLLDLPPTILHTLGLPVPSGMQGNVLRGLFSQTEWQDVQYTEDDGDDRPQDIVGYSAKERAEIDERLRGLGYID